MNQPEQGREVLAQRTPDGVPGEGVEGIGGVGSYESEGGVGIENGGGEVKNGFGAGRSRDGELEREKEVLEVRGEAAKGHGADEASERMPNHDGAYTVSNAIFDFGDCNSTTTIEKVTDGIWKFTSGNEVDAVSEARGDLVGEIGKNGPGGEGLARGARSRALASPVDGRNDVLAGELNGRGGGIERRSAERWTAERARSRRR